MASPLYINAPYHFDRLGRTAQSGSYEDYVKGLVLSVLMTAPGERVNHPEFGAGLLELIFEPNSPALAQATEHRVRSGLQRWLSDVLALKDLTITPDDNQLNIDLTYEILVTGETQRQTIVRQS